ncbi:hypothetical protein CR513_30027, partial [Mucuna pruriens]
MVLIFLLMMLKRNKRCNKMRIWVMLLDQLLDHLQSNSGGLIGRDNHLQDILLMNGEEPECYQESMESEERQKAWQSRLQKCVALSTIKAELGFKSNTLKPARSLFIRGEGVGLGDREKWIFTRQKREGEKERKKAFYFHLNTEESLSLYFVALEVGFGVPLRTRVGVTSHA